jgi:hypothetical protein
MFFIWSHIFKSVYQVLLWIVSWFFCFGNLVGNFMKLICQGMLPWISPNLKVTISRYLGHIFIYLFT